jgi:tetratricopeptide (TPR) repeat protein
VTNVFLHLLNGLLVFVILRRWFEIPLAGFGAALFLFHPLQTEAVAYVASRSDVLSTLFAYGALAFYLRRRQGIGFGGAALVIALLGAAVLTKEQTAVLPVLLILADYFSGDGIAKNWRLHGPVALAGVAGVAWVLRALQYAGKSAGFAVEGMKWYEYFFTQCRVIWRYLGLAVLPLGQNADTDFPISRSLADHGAIVGLAGLAAASVAAWIYRKRFPAAALGWFLFLTSIAPTSSFVPIADVVAERRMYFPFLGILLIAAEGARRVKIPVAAMAAMVAVCAGLTWSRAAVWGDPIELWKDTVTKSPNKARPHFQLAYAYYAAEQYGPSLAEFERTAQLQKADVRLLVLDGAGKPDEALAKLEAASRMERSGHVLALMGMIHAKNARYEKALEALAEAEKADPRFAMTYVYRGNVHRIQGRTAEAQADYERALGIDPGLSRVIGR